MTDREAIRALADAVVHLTSVLRENLHYDIDAEEIGELYKIGEAVEAVKAGIADA